MNVKLKTLLLNSLIICTSIFIAYLGLESILTLSVYTTGSAQGLADKRWRENYWHPINTMGYRDYDVNGDFYKKPAMIFLGDSFTSGHGIKFEETYYFLLRARFKNNFNFVNLGMNGASTKDESINYLNFLKQTRSNSGIVVHQYFGNDIEDYIDFNKRAISSSWVFKVGNELSSKSEIFSLISSLVGGWAFGDVYVKKNRKSVLE